MSINKVYIDKLKRDLAMKFENSEKCSYQDILEIIDIAEEELLLNSFIVVVDPSTGKERALEVLNLDDAVHIVVDDYRSDGSWNYLYEYLDTYDYTYESVEFKEVNVEEGIEIVPTDTGEKVVVTLRQLVLESVGKICKEIDEHGYYELIPVEW